MLDFHKIAISGRGIVWLIMIVTLVAWENLDAAPTFGDIESAQQQAFEHRHNAAKAMSNNDSMTSLIRSSKGSLRSA